MMKNILFLLMVLCLSVIGIKAVEGSSLFGHEEERTACLSLGDDSSSYHSVTEAVFADAIDFPFKDMTISASKNLVRQLRSCSRSQKNGYLSAFCRAHASGWKKALLRLDDLSHSSTHIYTTLPCLCWEYSSDHYIFGMRRILI